MGPRGGPAFVQVLRPAPGVRVLGVSRAPRFPPAHAAGPQPLPAKLSAHLPRLMGPAPGVPGWSRRPGAVGLLRQNGRRVFPSPLCFPPTKGRVSVRPAFAQPPGGPGRAGAKRAGAGWRGAPKAQTSHFFPGSSRAFLSCSRLSLLRVPAHIQAASQPGCQGERRPFAGRSGAGGGRRDSRKEKKKDCSHPSWFGNQKGSGMLAFGVQT